MKQKIVRLLIVIMIIFVMPFKTSLVSYAQNDEKQQPNSYYKIPVSLWHFKEDKMSMGNGALSQDAEIHKTKEGSYLYINSKKMEFSNIISTLINIYYLDENSKTYKKSKGYDYSISIPDTNEKFPSVFEIPIDNEKEYIDVMVDPKVEVMGDQPILARIKLDYSNIQKIDEKSSTILPKLSELREKSKEEFDFTRISRKVSMTIEEDSFEEEFDFYANKVVGNEEEKIQKLFEDEVLVSYKLSALSKIEEIPEDKAFRVNETRKQVQPKNQVQISIEKSKEMEYFEIFYLENDKKTKVNYEELDGNIIFLTDKMGVFTFVKSLKNAENQNTKATPKESLNNKENPSKNDQPNTTKNADLNTQDNSKAQNFLSGIKNIQKNSSLPMISSSNNSNNTSVLANNQVSNANTKPIINVKIYTNGNVEEKDEDEILNRPKEHYNLIFLCIAFITIVIITSILLIRKYYLKIIEELEIDKEIKQRKNEK